MIWIPKPVLKANTIRKIIRIPQVTAQTSVFRYRYSLLLISSFEEKNHTKKIDSTENKPPQAKTGINLVNKDFEKAVIPKGNRRCIHDKTTIYTESKPTKPTFLDLRLSFTLSEASCSVRAFLANRRQRPIRKSNPKTSPILSGDRPNRTALSASDAV